MNYCKLTIEERDKLRAFRTLWQIVFKRIHERNFKYVLQREEAQKVCFGSGVERECLPFKGPSKSPLMRRFIPDHLEGPGPLTYNVQVSLLKKLPTKSGYAGLSYRAPRVTMKTVSGGPPIGCYDLSPPSTPKQCPRPFNIGATRSHRTPFLTPAPGTYLMRKRNIKINKGFGKQRIFTPAVRTICLPRNLSKCCICEEQPLGDYWQSPLAGQDMCRPCMVKDRHETNMLKSKNKKMKRLAELNAFERVRYCGYHHEHGGTRAAVKKLSKRQLNLKFRTENYLAMFHY